MEAWFHNRPKLKNRLNKLVGSRDEVEDLLQDLFVKVYRNRENFDVEYADRYLMAAANNLARDYVRNKARRRFVPEMDVLNSETPEDVFWIAERSEFYREVVKPVMEELPTKQRDALWAYCSGNNLKEMARRTGVHYSTFLGRRNSALRILKTRLARYQRR